VSGIRCWILRSREEPVEADPARVSMSWDLPAVFASGALEVAPGVEVKVLAYGDHWVPRLGEPVHGALVAVRTQETARPRLRPGFGLED